MTTSKQSPLIRLSLLGIAAIGFMYASQSLGQLTQWINQLPVEGTPLSSEAAPAPPTVLATSPVIHPLLVESSLKAAALHTKVESSAPMVSLDTLFGRTAALATAAPARADLPLQLNTGIDDALALRQAVRLQAVTLKGAILNDVYYAIGEPVLTAPYFSAKAQGVVYPLLSAVSPRGVTLREAGRAHKTVQVTLPD